MSAKIAINGFGRIGRCVARILKETGGEQLELVAINDLTPAHTLAHLLQFDSVHGEWTREVFAEGSAITIGSQTIPVYSEADPSKLPWAELSVDLVLECTGRFRSREGAGKHLNAGAKRVVISAPGEIGIDHTLCMGINSDSFDPMSHQIISNASCTTNCLAPLAKVLHERFGLLKGHMVTVHSYTNDQRILDSPHQDLRRARAAALSMIPTTTGAAKAIELVMPELKGTLDGVAIRVPTPNVSIVCLTAQVARPTTRDAVNAAFEEAAEGPLNGILGYEKRPLVSTDYIGNRHSSIVDASQTQVVGDDLVEVQSWYDNEWGFSNRLVDLAKLIAARS